MRIGAVSIAPAIDNPAGIEFSRLYEAFGRNTGNFMFTTCVYRQFAAEVDQIGFHFDPDQVNAEYDLVVVPAANWLTANGNWDWLCDLIERLAIPVVTIGIGAQAETTAAGRFVMSASCERLARLLASRSPYVSTRGHFTTAVLQAMGILNAVSTGCPSLYLRLPAGDTRPAHGGGLAVQSTRYGFAPPYLSSETPNRRLFALAGRRGHEMIYQSEPEEIDYLIRGGEAVLIGGPAARRLHELYGFSTHAELLRYLDDHGRVFLDVDSWARHIQRFDRQIGTRLHGAIAALNSGVPAILLGHDSRTAEMIGFAAIPTVAEGVDPSLMSDAEIASLFKPDNMAAYLETRHFNARIYRAFLAASGIPVNEAAMLD